MAYKLIQYHLDIINKYLPPQFAALKDRYPSTIFNAADHWDRPKFPQGYVPKDIEIYYQESAIRPAICWENGRLEDIWIDEDIPVNPDVMVVKVDNIWTYIRIQQQVILDRTEGDTVSARAKPARIDAQTPDAADIRRQIQAHSGVKTRALF